MVGAAKLYDGLTRCEYKFASLVAQGYTNVDAYKATFNTKASKYSITVNASKLRKKANVALTISKLAQKTEQNVEYSLVEHFNEVEEARNLARESGDIKTFLRATELKGKLCGYYVEKHQLEGASEHNNIKVVVNYIGIDGENATISRVQKLKVLKNPGKVPTSD